MSNEFVVMYCLMLVAVGLYALGLYLFQVRAQKRFFAAHPEFPNPFDKPHHHPAE